jgi:hypothetical protein
MIDATQTPRPPRTHARRVALSLLAFAGLVVGATSVIVLLVSVVTMFSDRG